MIRFNGFLHREQLAKVLDRILSMEGNTDATIREDSRDLKQIVNFNAYCGCLILDAFTRTLFERLYGAPALSDVVQTKGALKDVIAHNLAAVSPRTKALVAQYHGQPHEFYRETPLNGRVYRSGDEARRLLGVSRVKRFRRIAEKASRYLIQAAGAPTARPLNDILGLKALCEAGDIERFIGTLTELDGCSIEERETHTGIYEATHLGVRFRWPRNLILLHPPQGRAAEILARRGSSGDIEREFRRFVETAEDEVHVEVILCSPAALVESEIGSSMHESRILAQRMEALDRNPSSRNIVYALDYLFRFCISSSPSLDLMPISLSGRYMPDYIDQLHARLLGASEETGFTQACICGHEPHQSAFETGNQALDLRKGARNQPSPSPQRDTHGEDTEVQKAAVRLKEILGLATEPVAVFFLPSPQGPVSFEGFTRVAGHRYCQLLMRARHGESVRLDPEELACPAAAAAFGFRPLPEKLSSGHGLVGFGIVSEPATGQAMFEGMTRIPPGKIEGLAACPLQEARALPDVVVVEGLPEHLMWLALADLNLAGGRRRRGDTAVLQATCVDATVIPHVEQRLNFSLGCYGCREATDMSESEAILGFPGARLGDLVAALEDLDAKAIGRSRAKAVFHHLEARCEE